MKTRIQQLFENKHSNITSVYYTAGFPQPDATRPILKALQDKGIDLVEIGIPFSDPMADGPVIQASSHQAISEGMSLKKLFEQLEGMRTEIHIPVILMGYVNVIMQFGIEAFCKACTQVGVDGVILPDLPMHDYLEAYKPIMDAYGLSMVLLITPETSTERILEIDKNTDSFIYMVSSAATTGAQTAFDAKKQDYFQRIHAMNLKNPCLIGFGISNKATYDAACKNAQGAIIGSRFITCLRQHPNDYVQAVDALLKQLQQ